MPALHLYFDERDNRTEETQGYTTKGFTEETVLNDFPVRDKKLVLHIRRRRWLKPDGTSCVLDVYPKLVANGTRFSAPYPPLRQLPRHILRIMGCIAWF